MDVYALHQVRALPKGPPRRSGGTTWATPHDRARMAEGMAAKGSTAAGVAWLLGDQP